MQITEALAWVDTSAAFGSGHFCAHTTPIAVDLNVFIVCFFDVPQNALEHASQNAGT